MDFLNSKVLVINRQWQGIGEMSVQDALCDLVRGACTAIDMENMIAVTWSDWVKLLIRDGDRSIRTVHFTARIPTVVCKSRYADMPKRRPRWSKKGVAKRDKYICQYTGQYAPDGNVDHVLAQGKGGRDTWSNTVWSTEKVNTKKRDKTLAELGWKLISRPSEPKELPMVRLIQPKHDDWRVFLCL